MLSFRRRYLLRLSRPSGSGNIWRDRIIPHGRHRRYASTSNGHNLHTFILISTGTASSTSGQRSKTPPYPPPDGPVRLPPLPATSQSTTSQTQVEQAPLPSADIAALLSNISSAIQPQPGFTDFQPPPQYVSTILLRPEPRSFAHIDTMLLTTGKLLQPSKCPNWHFCSSLPPRRTGAAHRRLFKCLRKVWAFRVDPSFPCHQPL